MGTGSEAITSAGRAPTVPKSTPREPAQKSPESQTINSIKEALRLGLENIGIKNKNEQKKITSDFIDYFVGKEYLDRTSGNPTAKAINVTDTFIKNILFTNIKSKELKPETLKLIETLFKSQPAESAQKKAQPVTKESLEAQRRAVVQTEQAGKKPITPQEKKDNNKIAEKGLVQSNISIAEDISKLGSSVAEAKKQQAVFEQELRGVTYHADKLKLIENKESSYNKIKDAYIKAAALAGDEENGIKSRVDDIIDVYKAKGADINSSEIQTQINQLKIQKEQAARHRDELKLILKKADEDLEKAVDPFKTTDPNYYRAG